jgi:hypothetical protein
MPINRISGASVYVHPETGKAQCAHCDTPMSFAMPERNRFSRSPESPQVWCENPECPAKDVVGDTPISTMPGSKHRMRSAAR